MNKRECIIQSAYVRRDVDWTVLSYAVAIKDVNSKSEYVYRFDFSPASFQKLFQKNENNINTLVWSKCYLNETITLS